MCRFCARRFAGARDLKRHELVHTGEKPFQCDVCSKSFTRVASLRDHQILHTGEKPFRCDKCNAGFVRKSLLRIHIRDRCKNTCLNRSNKMAPV
ncbi:putative zinc finger protein [Apostichopus japonicus]|uniref:Putative zinc finger protein n=1 Tax=Stichopus japonicus TaxID=307972 RepID=A0A2G8K262_STIJA|nr:putative zinc finger protein [Apostichopus japonicus]